MFNDLIVNLTGNDLIAMVCAGTFIANMLVSLIWGYILINIASERINKEKKD